ncbi:hypothetical protein NUH86_18445 [Sphingobium sp. JS3065]|uniref:hypothetical protein n=1 Tax=Sphingobium sp. JS3065 TaxID=2970925 RepID=UPI0022644B7E|nr:hypothetical protein [Sphingobium sp. JS3065]UZW57563.1 hypothetical protein NUH86_18445 [Sphingobium sp. JS3065]
MIELTAQQLAAHYMAATAQLLTGEPGREMDLDRTVAISFGAPKSTSDLLSFALQHVVDRPCMYLAFDIKRMAIDHVALILVHQHKLTIFEGCGLWLPKNGGRASLIPGTKGLGAYRVGSDLILQHDRQLPFRSRKTHIEGFGRADDRIHSIVSARVLSGVELNLPEEIQLAA